MIGVFVPTMTKCIWESYGNHMGINCGNLPRWSDDQFIFQGGSIQKRRPASVAQWHAQCVGRKYEPCGHWGWFHLFQDMGHGWTAGMPLGRNGVKQPADLSYSWKKCNVIAMWAHVKTLNRLFRPFYWSDLDWCLCCFNMFQFYPRYKWSQPPTPFMHVPFAARSGETRRENLDFAGWGWWSGLSFNWVLRPPQKLLLHVDNVNPGLINP